jgi:hypothetical protein
MNTALESRATESGDQRVAADDVGVEVVEGEGFFFDVEFVDDALQELGLDAFELAVGDVEEVAGAAGGIEDLEGVEAPLELALPLQVRELQGRDPTGQAPGPLPPESPSVRIPLA